ncbi:ATP-binding protein [Tautonia plasticadhaerens]|uniref:histidine kinase n=1 Tax=Tautonia plasticadhaerens TaxID=2527974 RepID=A0A518GXE3_9BACT|nr:ATP-binding protein [Tautonia plasticadhaerens]QDV33251.1 Sporulation kinase E [Tautonia plasticadhaerens]
MASLLVVQGADRGRRFSLSDRPTALGRERSSPIRLHDSEVSRRHAEVRPEGDAVFRLVDLGSANGTFVNGLLVDQATLRPGDRVQIGSTVLLFDSSPAAKDDLTDRVDLLALARAEDRSEIVRSLPVGHGQPMLGAPESAGEWLKVRLANLSVMYQATRAISHVLDPDALLPQILQLVFESIGADRGAILLLDPGGALEPKAVRWRGPADDPEERMRISRSIVDHVLTEGQGVITLDAPVDRRFGPSQSIVDYGIREAICVPVQGRHTTLGVLYADVRGSREVEVEGPDRGRPKGKFTQEHLMLMVAIGHQAGLAIESTNFYRDKVEAERLAAVGQTIATLSHHIKNIMQGIKGGSYLVEMGLDQKDETITRRGWGIVEKNQAKIYNLVMDMLSFSKDREPALEPSDLNEVVGDVVELMQARAAELSVSLEWRPAADATTLHFDPDGIHRAILNIVTNALDAAEGRPDPRVIISNRFDADAQTALVVVEDNGIGIPEPEQATIFEVFASTKGSRGTGLGLPVSDKIVREHGGRIVVDSTPGVGSRFTVELPMKGAEESGDDDPFATAAE